VRSVIVAGLYSLTDEFHQSYVAGRGPSLIDSGIDTAGAAFATCLLWLRQWLLQAIRARAAARNASTDET
jgi:VanZ family protein